MADLSVLADPGADSRLCVQKEQRMVNCVTNVWVLVQDVDRALDFYQITLELSLIKREGPWAEISEHDWGRVATFKDSEGNDLQLYEPPSS